VGSGLQDREAVGAVYEERHLAGKFKKTVFTASPRRFSHAVSLGDFLYLF
jgi:hypothetical protein